jgi:hypothetical protein
MALLLATGICVPAQGQDSNNWLRPNQGVRQARYNANHERQVDSDPFVDDAPSALQSSRTTCASDCGCASSSDGKSCTSLACESCTSCDSCQSDSCQGGCCAAGGCPLGFLHGGGGAGGGGILHGGQVIVGGEYLYVRPTFSQALSAIKTTGFGSSNTVDNHVEFDFDYDHAFRGYVGYRLPDCCCELIGSYTRITGDAWASCEDNAVDEFCVGPNELNTPDGGRLDSDLRVRLNAYDLELSKTIMFGCPCWPIGPGCVVPYANCGGCRTACCPAWDVTWFLGARFADLGWGSNYTTFSATSATLSNSSTVMQFHGAGPRAGLRVRKYFGRQGGMSLFARGTGSLLIGNYELGTTVTSGGATLQRVVDARRIVPVMELELGGSIHLGRNVTVSSGYMVQTWFDMGMSDEFTNVLTGFQPLDDSNLLSFDGFFLRGEVAF